MTGTKKATLAESLLMPGEAANFSRFIRSIVLGTSYRGNTEITIPDGHLLLNTDCSATIGDIQDVFPRKTPLYIGPKQKIHVLGR